MSVQAGTKELFLSARLAAALAYVALNLQKSDFQKLKVPDSFEAFGRRNKAFKRQQDRGFAFVAMIFNGGTFDGDEVEFVERCVALSGLGTPNEIIAAAASEMANPFWFSGGNNITAHFSRETAMSRQILEAHAKLPNYILTLQSLVGELRTVCPPFLDADANFVELSAGRIDEYEPEMMHDAAHALRAYTRNLLSGCRGI